MAAITMHQAVRAYDFTDTIGINTHTGWRGAYDSFERVKEALDYLGINHIRDEPFSATDVSRLNQLSAATAEPLKINAVVGNDNLPIHYAITGPASLKARLDLLAGITNLVSIEGPNEVDLNPFVYEDHTDRYVATRYLMEDVALQTNGNPVLSKLPVLQASIGHNWTHFDELAAQNVGQYADYAVNHFYGQHGETVGSLMANNLKWPLLATPGKPQIITEMGYSSSPTSPNLGHTETAQAEYTPRIFLEAFQAGVERTYLYQLIENREGTGWSETLGLFNPDGTPKPAAKAMHNFMLPLDDDGATAATFATKPLDYGISGLSDPANHLLTQRSDGSYVMALWKDAKSYDYATKTDTIVVPDRVVITFANPVEGAWLTDTITGEKLTLANATTISFDVPDHAVMLEIKQDTGPVSQVTPADAPPPTSPAGPAVPTTPTFSTASFTGTNASELIVGNAFDNMIFGRHGDDTIYGGAGNDQIEGNVGNDVLHGGDGEDVFIIGSSKAMNEVILDFTKGQDRIDLGERDATTRAAGWQDFSFIGSSAFTTAGQLRAYQDEAKGITVIEGNTDNDAAAEVRIECTGLITFTRADFIL